MTTQHLNETFSLEHVVPYFQPIVDITNDRVWCYECLARLVTPGEYIFLPNQFLHLVEREQSVERFTETIFTRSAEYFRDINVAWNINISEADMTSPALIKMLTHYLEDYPNPQRISVELTAQSALAHLNEFKAFSKTCADIGVGVFIDHFGSISKDDRVLLETPVTGIKVAGSLIASLDDDQDVRHFVQTLIDTGKKQRITVVAEHIEDEQTLDLVKGVGFQFAQGFYFSTPKAEAEPDEE